MEPCRTTARWPLHTSRVPQGDTRFATSSAEQLRPKSAKTMQVFFFCHAEH